MSWRPTVVLIGIVAALCALLYFTRADPGSTGPATVSLLDDHRIGKARAIRWRIGAQPPIEVTRSGSTFWITQPMRDLASSARMLAIATAYDRTTVEEAFGDREIDERLLEEIGLSPPAATIEIEFEDGSVTRAELGARGVLGSDIYLRRNGRIYHGAEALYTSLVAGLDDLRERRLFENSEMTTRRVSVDHELGSKKREKLTLQFSGREWRILSPIECRTEPAATARFLKVLLGLRIDLFLASPMRLPDERPPDIEIEVSGDCGNETVRLWRDLSTGILLGRIEKRSVDFQLDPTQVADLFDLALANLRAKWVFPIADMAADLARVVIDRGEEAPRIRIERLEGERGFRLIEPVDAIVGETPMAELIQALNNCRVLQFVEGDPEDPRFSFSKRVLEVGVQDRFAPTLTRLRIGADGTEGGTEVSYARRVDEPSQVFAIPRQVGERLRRHWSEYVRSEVFASPLPPVDRLRVVRDGREMVYEAEGTHWYLRKEGGAGLPDEDVAELVPELRDLRASHVSLRDESMEPDWTLSLCRKQGDTMATLEVYERGEGQPVWVRPAGSSPLLYEPGRSVSRILLAIGKAAIR